MSEQKNSPDTIIVVTILCIIASVMLVFYIIAGSSQSGTSEPEGCTPMLVGRILVCV